MAELTFTITVCTNKIGSEGSIEVKVEEQEWLEMSDLQRDEYMRDELENSMLYSWSYDQQQ